MILPYLVAYVFVVSGIWVEYGIGQSLLWAGILFAAGAVVSAIVEAVQESNRRDEEAKRAKQEEAKT